jgi:hypothetical protein
MSQTAFSRTLFLDITLGDVQNQVDEISDYLSSTDPNLWDATITHDQAVLLSRKASVLKLAESDRVGYLLH